MKFRNLFTLLVVVLVSISILFAQTETKKTDAPKDKSCCPSEKSAKSEVKAEGKKAECTSKDATHKHVGKSDCTSKEAKDSKKECQKGDDCCQKTGVKKCDDSKSKDGKYECPGKTEKQEKKKI